MAGAKRSASNDTPVGLATLIKSAPKLSSPKEARARVDEWLGEIARTPAGKALKPPALTLAIPSPQIQTRSVKLAGLVAAIAEGSPYLWDLIRAEPDRLLGILEAEPEAHFAAVLAEVTRAGLAEQDEAAMMRVLRRGKAEAALMIALADIGGVWPVERVTRALTEFADAAAGAAVRFLLRGMAAQGKLTLRNPAAPEEGSGYVVLAMGKMGAHRAQLFERYRPDRSLRRGLCRARRRAPSPPRCSCASRAGW